ncbi:tRNA-dihydrouridine synthase family protein [Halosquirtibacter laminarini]|uniref:tRNA-dihydrouridine synthase family protein n=1 Tax=Halosquirtibacter laminarini TaxID=3374600 RepID=A0AC61NNK6_9BACT|nr:tRNA-dihydrouridine synthase family protein [Prolixibacteraceae bacterium]
MKLYLAPLQEYTEYSYRNAINKYIGTFDKYFIPYISYNNDKKLKNRQQRDILTENNQNIHVVPQILASNKQEIEFLIPFLSDYKELNINFGCPYPMATKRGRGAGIYNHIEATHEILDTILKEFDGKVSIKMRSGLESHETWKEMVDILNEYDLEEVIIHPRTAKQLYKGKVDLSYLDEFVKKLRHDVIYNGDINTLEDYSSILSHTNLIKGAMLGRGALNDIHLVQKIKQNDANIENQLNILIQIHQDVFQDINEQTDIEQQVIQKMERFWSYFCNHFNNSHKVYKKFKKSRNINEYKAALSFAKQQGVQ